MNRFRIHCIECGATLYRDTPASVPCEFCGEGTMNMQEWDGGPELDAQTRDTLTEADKAEFVTWWDEKNRERRKPMLVRMRCSDEHCRRILYRENAKPFRCTACGHGELCEQVPKAQCCICGGPIFDNVNSKCEVVCWLCVAKKVEGIGCEEPGRQVEFKDTRDWTWHGLKPDGRLTLGERLRKARKEKGWTQTLLAGRLGISRRSVVRMETGLSILPQNALDFIEMHAPIGKKLKPIDSTT